MPVATLAAGSKAEEGGVFVSELAPHRHQIGAAAAFLAPPCVSELAPHRHQIGAAASLPRLRASAAVQCSVVVGRLNQAAGWQIHSVQTWMPPPSAC